MVAGYVERIDQVAALHASGLSVRDIDQQVRYDDGAAQAALTRLQAAIAERRAAVADALTADLQRAGEIARLAAIVTINVSALLVVVLFVALIRGVINRSQTITEALERLADGDDSVALSEFESETEMGAIARAAKRFRDHANEMVALKEQMLDETQARAASRA